MEKCKDQHTPPSQEYDLYTAEYMSALFTMFHPLQSFRYPSTNTSISYVPSWKVHKSQTEPSLQVRQNAVRYLLNFHQIYSQNFSPFMFEVLRNLPSQRRLVSSYNDGRLHSTRLQSTAVNRKDYLELNRRRPSVIRRGINSNGQSSSPREAILEPNFNEVDEEIEHEHTQIIHKEPQSESTTINKDLHPENLISRVIHKDSQYESTFTHGNPQFQHLVHKFVHKYPEHLISPITSRKRPIQNNLYAEHIKSPITKTKQQKSTKTIENTLFQAIPDRENANFDKTKEQSNTYVENRSPDESSYSADNRAMNPRENSHSTDSKNLEKPKKTHFDSSSSKTIAVQKFNLDHLIKNDNTKIQEKSDSASLTQTENTKKDKKSKFCCFHCKKRFRWFSHWQAHERTHTGERPFKCTQCDRCFTRGDGLQAHMVIHNTKTAHKCQTCGKLFTRKTMLERHIVEHTGTIPFKCNVCGVEISDVEKIEEHLVKHQGHSKFKCQYCPRSFINGQRLVRHIRAHTGEKPFHCSQCNMKFSKKSALTIHHRVHSGAKPFSCLHCGKSFSISGNLRRHLLIHTGERPYECSVCNKRFNNKSHLARHFSSQHKKEMK